MTQTRQAPVRTTKDRSATMDVMVGCVLLGGVVVSVVLLVAGLAWHWIKTGQLGAEFEIANMNLFQFLVAEIHGVAAGAIRPRLLIGLGIAALLLTPYLRVAASLTFFVFVEHNWKYSAFTGFVLAVLTYSLFLR